MEDFKSKIKTETQMFRDKRGALTIEQFMSMLKPEVSVSDRSISCTNWTARKGDNGLIICGGIINGTDYLASLQYGIKLHNQYNNYVNPLYLEDILTIKGVKFFKNYYKDELTSLALHAESEAEHLRNKANKLDDYSKSIIDYLKV
ncbi:hypothetical protein ORI99_00230 [Alishewanella sp. SMS9]|nr:hypothetical protein [Alishewanella sp. SMS9]